MARIHTTFTVPAGANEAAVFQRIMAAAEDTSCKVTPKSGAFWPRSVGREIGILVEGSEIDLDLFTMRK